MGEKKMEKSILVRKVSMDCPICDKTHEVEERKRLTTTILKGEKVTYQEVYYCCTNEKDENEFENGAMADANLMNARNAYRVKMGLLTSDEIVAIRECYGMSQVDLARVLGWGEATVSRYESKAIQDKPYDIMLRLIRDNPLKALEMLKKNGGQIAEARQNEIRSKIIIQLAAHGREYLTRQTLEGEYAEFDTPSDYNGYSLLNIDRLETIISYLAEPSRQVRYFFKTKLMKLLWYSDSLACAWNGKGMTGLVYTHETMGALPIGHYALMNLENLNIREETSKKYDSMLHIYPSELVDYSILSRDDKKVLDAVIAKFKDYKANEIVDYMHAEKAYTETSLGELIPFTLAAQIKMAAEKEICKPM